MKEDRINFQGMISNFIEETRLKRTYYSFQRSTSEWALPKGRNPQTKVRVHCWILKDLETGRETETHGQFVTGHSLPQIPRDVEKGENSEIPIF